MICFADNGFQDDSFFCDEEISIKLKDLISDLIEEDETEYIVHFTGAFCTYAAGILTDLKDEFSDIEITSLTTNHDKDWPEGSPLEGIRDIVVDNSENKHFAGNNVNSHAHRNEWIFKNKYITFIAFYDPDKSITNTLLKKAITLNCRIINVWPLLKDDEEPIIINSVKIDKLNKYCWAGRIGDLLLIDRDAFVNDMKNTMMSDMADNVSRSQIYAWKNCYTVLKNTFENLPENYKNLHIVFEYNLPIFKPSNKGKVNGQCTVKADAVIVSKDTVLVLEFKRLNKDNLYIGSMKQLQKYIDRFNNWHIESKNMKCIGILIPTHDKGSISKIVEGKYLVSPKSLPKVIKEVFDKNPDTMSNDEFNRWVNSEYKSK